jgi:acyl-CoA hydrolase
VEANGRRTSRIIARHPEGAIVTTPRQYIQLLVTEHGAVDLGDLSDAERIMAIASVADPDFRPGLEAEAHGLIRALRAQR